MTNVTARNMTAAMKIEMAQTIIDGLKPDLNAVLAMRDRVQNSPKTSDTSYATKADIAEVLGEVTGKAYGKKVTREELVAELDHVAYAMTEEMRAACEALQEAECDEQEEVRDFEDARARGLDTDAVGGDFGGVDAEPASENIEYESAPATADDWTVENASKVIALMFRTADGNFLKNYVSKFMLASHITEALFGRPMAYRQDGKTIYNEFSDDEKARANEFFKRFKERYLPAGYKGKGFIITSELMAWHYKNHDVIYRFSSAAGHGHMDYKLNWGSKTMTWGDGKSMALDADVFRKIDSTCEFFKVV